MENYPSNSKVKVQTEGTQAKETAAPVKNIERIVTTEVTRRKKPLGRKFLETFGGGDAQGVGSYILQDVLLPAAKDMVADAVSQGIEKMLFGEARGGGGRPRAGIARKAANSTYTSYNKFAVNPAHRRDPREVSRRARASHDFDEIILDSRAEAQGVLDQMIMLLNDYDEVTVADLYEMVGTTGSFTDQKWGWTDLRGATVHRVRDGYLLDLPRTEEID